VVISEILPFAFDFSGLIPDSGYQMTTSSIPKWVGRVDLVSGIWNLVSVAEFGGCGQTVNELLFGLAVWRRKRESA